MLKQRHHLIAAVLLVMAAEAGAEAGESSEWAQWRGPDRNGSTTLLTGKHWPEKLEHRWRSEVGSGQSSPVVAEGVVYTFTRKVEREVARALRLDSGEQIWESSYPAPYEVYPGAQSFGAGPKSTPLVLGDSLITLGIGGTLSAFDRSDGERRWQKHFDDRFKAGSPPFGTVMSPLQYDGSLIVHVGGHDGGALLALDPRTGEERWSRVGEGPSYSSPVLIQVQNQPQLVLQVHRRLLGVDPASGRELWSLPFVTPCDQNVVTPLAVGNLVITSSVDTGTLGVEISPNGDGWSARIAWRTSDVSMYMSSPVLFDGRMVGLSHKKRGEYFALDPQTGDVLWTGDSGRGPNAVFVAAADRLLILEDDGLLLVMSGDGQGLSIEKRYQVAETATYAHPVPTSEGLLIKDASHLSLFEPARRAAEAQEPDSTTQ